MSDPSPPSPSPSSNSSPRPRPPKRPSLSLQIQAIVGSSISSSPRLSRAIAAAVDVKDPTTFNTLSNVYATAIDRSTPVSEEPPAFSRRSRQPCLDTSSAQPVSSAIAPEGRLPSAMTATPPLSATSAETHANFEPEFEISIGSDSNSTGSAMAKLPSTMTPTGTRAGRRLPQSSSSMNKPPYTHPRTLRSILRNSPLPAPKSRKSSPISPRRQSRRIAERAARRVAYHSPLCQTITTSKYTVPHVDLLNTDDGASASPYTPSTDSVASVDSPLDAAMDDAVVATPVVGADGGNDPTRNGGDTPGPFEEVRRRVASLETTSPLSPSGAGVRKRPGGGKHQQRKEKKRRWVWTIGVESDESGGSAGYAASVIDSPGGAAAAAVVSTRGVLPKEPPRLPTSVPVLAVPSPRPKTRRQTVESPPAACPVATPSSSVPILAIPSPRPTRKRLQAVMPLSLSTPPPPPRPSGGDDSNKSGFSSAASSSVEPPTPSADSTMSMTSQESSVFEEGDGAAADVDMSDVSSFASETERVDVWGARGEVDDAEDMDADTPTATEMPLVLDGLGCDKEVRGAGF